MGVTPEQKLVIKHTFLEYVCDQAPSSPNCEPSRQRSWTEPTIEEDLCYGEVREIFHGSDGSTSGSEAGDDAGQVEHPCTSTPEISPLHCPAAARHITFSQEDSSWEVNLPSEACGRGEYISWSEQQWSEQYANGNWWTPVAYDVNAGLAMNYCGAAGPDQTQCSTMVRSSVLSPIAENDVEVSLPQLPPSTGELAQGGNPSSDKETRTTVMLRGLPETYTRTAMLQLLGAEGFFGRFNFVYLPIDFKRCKNLGYALINLVSATEALRLRKRFEGFSNWDVPGGSVCAVAWCSPQQGLQAHVERYRNSPVMHESVPEEWRPMLLAHGVQITFPPPTVRIKAPRLKGTQ